MSGSATRSLHTVSNSQSNPPISRSTGLPENSQSSSDCLFPQATDFPVEGYKGMCSERITRQKSTKPEKHIEDDKLIDR